MQLIFAIETNMGVSIVAKINNTKLSFNFGLVSVSIFRLLASKYFNFSCQVMVSSFPFFLHTIISPINKSLSISSVVSVSKNDLRCKSS